MYTIIFCRIMEYFNLTELWISHEAINSSNVTFDKNSSWTNESDHLFIPSIDVLNAVTGKFQILLITMYSVTALLSLVGNITVISVLCCGKRSSRELRMLLINLAVSDITMAIFCIPFTYTQFLLNRWIFAPVFCPIVQFMQMCSVMASVYTLTIIGIDR